MCSSKLFLYCTTNVFCLVEYYVFCFSSHFYHRNAPRRRLHRRRGLRGRYTAHGPDSVHTLDMRWRGRIAPPPLVRRAAPACATPHMQPGQGEQSGARRSAAAAQAAGAGRVPLCGTYDRLSGGLAPDASPEWDLCAGSRHG
jgi:hypothetical protein